MRILLPFILIVASCLRTTLGDVPSTWIDDAQLNDVTSVSTRFIVAVGEHGAIWISDDGGRRWRLSPSGVDVSLRSVCFLDDQHGWIAGSNVTPHTGMDSGILLQTIDGGKSWKRMNKETLPPLNSVKFFDLDEGILVGQPASGSTSGIYKTKDGGQNWRGVPGSNRQSWKAASFLQVEMGVVAGTSGQVSVMAGEGLFESNLPARGLRSVRSIRLSTDERGWLAGDGGLVLTTSNGGVVWEAPSKPLPDGLREQMDFRALDLRGSHVWLGGSPGSSIWHSADNGAHWEKQSTGQTIPLSAIRFQNENQGIAIGALGLIIRTEDGGKNWLPVRGGNRRAALLSLQSRTTQVSPPALVKLSGEMGYRSAVWVAQRNDLSAQSASNDSELRLQTSIQHAGGNAAEIHWQFPITTPGLEYSTTQLMDEWQRQTEGRLKSTFVGQLVKQIRMWRPSVLIVDQPATDDAAGTLLHDATLRAVEQAGEASRYLEQIEMTGLKPWKVDRVFIKLASGASGETMIDLDEFLPHWKTSNRLASQPSAALLEKGKQLQGITQESPRISFRKLDDFSGQSGRNSSERNGSASTRTGDFFGGLNLNPGSESRRDLLPIDESRLEEMQAIIQRQRNFSAVTQKSLDDPRISQQLLGQLRVVTKGMESSQAAILLKELADQHRARSQFELTEATYLELVQRYPREPVSLEAMRWLIQFWCSNETAWQRLRTMTSDSSVSQTRIDQRIRHVDPLTNAPLPFDEEIRQARAESNQNDMIAAATLSTPTRMNLKLDLDQPSRDGKKTKPSARMKLEREVDWRSGSVEEWSKHAIEYAKQLETIAPGMYKTGEIQFPLAALRRGNGSPRAAEGLLHSLLSHVIDDDSKQLIRSELWTSFQTTETPPNFATCYRTSTRPNLDAVLSDRCWESASEILLSNDATPRSKTPDSANESGRAMVMFSYDDQFLYVAYSVPRIAGGPEGKPQQQGRMHDADLSRHDRLTLRLDVDRDYHTWYEFEIDQRGWTSERCWEDTRWNPNWFVAVDGDSRDWRIEAAIAWSDLVPTPPKPGTIYAISLTRTTPMVGFQSWTSNQLISKPAAFGLLKLD